MEVVTPASTVAFVGALAYHIPALRPIFQEHLDDEDGQVLPHIFIADVERWLETEYLNRYQRSQSVIDELFEMLEEGIGGQDSDISELIHVSLEHLPREGQPGSELRNLLGPKMRIHLAQIEG